MPFIFNIESKVTQKHDIEIFIQPEHDNPVRKKTTIHTVILF
ncbi:hypothetical protein CSB69_0500 [Morganella morganii]|nr:hypothetical protein CSB69_0500 [Morganella morganii]